MEAHSAPFCIEFQVYEIQAIRSATIELNNMALALVERACNSDDSDKVLESLLVPPEFRNTIRNSWRRGDSTIYGRFDLAIADGEIKLLEMNFDTPTSLSETALLQLAWLEDMKSEGTIVEDADQFNFLDEELRKLFAQDGWQKGLLHLGFYQGADEDAETVKYLSACAQLAGVSTKLLEMSELKRAKNGTIVDSDLLPVKHLFKLYPWELLLRDDMRMRSEFDSFLFKPLLDSGELKVVEPAWKLILSSKAALPLLWQMFPQHPLLLRAGFDDWEPDANVAYVRKPIFGREGGGIEIVLPDETIRNAGEFGEEGFVRQEYFELPKHDSYHLVVGSWIVDSVAAGIGVRADKSKITGRGSLFVPHYVI